MDTENCWCRISRIYPMMLETSLRTDGYDDGGDIIENKNDDGEDIIAYFLNPMFHPKFLLANLRTVLETEG